jgi:hypothetical protein
MARTKLLFVDVNKKTAAMSHITFQQENTYKAFDRPAADRVLYVPIDLIRELNEGIAKALEDSSIKAVNEKPV